MALAAIHLERPGDDRVRLSDAHRLVDAGGKAPEHHRRALAEVRHGRARRAVERRPYALAAHVAVVVPDRFVGAPRNRVAAVVQPTREEPQAIAPLAGRPAHDAPGEWVLRRPRLAAGVRGRLRLVG